MDHSSKKITLEEPVSQIELELEVLGCYSLPESWKPAEIETLDFVYQVNFLGLQVQNGKIRKRELTEEEIKAVEEAKKGKKDPPKKKGLEVEAEVVDDKKRVDELTRRGSQSSRYDDEALFYSNKEDIFKNPCIAWETENSNDQRPIKTYPVSQQIEEMKMLELLECIEDNGLYLDFARIPKTTEEESKKKPAKGKQQEEAKSTYYKAWVDLSNFKGFAVTEQQLRVKLEDLEGEEVSHAKSYLLIKIRFNTAIFPLPPPQLTNPQDLIPTKPPPPKFLPSKDGTHDFQRQIKLACKAIAAEYHNSYAEQLADMNSLPLQKQKELRDIRRDEFLYNFNTSGKSQILKNKLRKSVVKICREKYKAVNTLKGLSFNEKDKIYSEVYAYLLSKMQDSLAEVTQEKREILHEEPILPRSLAETEKQEKISEILSESYDQKLGRLAHECEITGKTQKAAKYLQERTERSPLETNVWLDLTRFALRQHNLTNSEKFMAEAISISGPDSTREEYLLMSCIYLSRKKYSEALVFLNNLLSKDNTDVLLIILISLTYKQLNKLNLEKLFLARAKRLFMKHYGMLGNKNMTIPSLENVIIRYEEGKGITTEIMDDLYFMVVEYLLSEKIVDIARLALERITNKDSCMIKFAYYTAETEYWSKEYQQSANALEVLLKLEPRHGQGWTLKGDSYFSSQKFVEAQECYLKALRYSKTNNSTLMLKLGNIYLQNKAWAGAKLLFSKCCEEEPTSIAWEGLGIACLNLNELDIAEKALTQANIMYDENSYTWTALAYLCLKKTEEPPGRYYQFRQCLTQAIRLGITDKELLVNIGHEYVRKFFLKGIEPNSQRLSVAEIKVIYKYAKVAGADVQNLKNEIVKEFEMIKDQGNNRLDANLINAIEAAKQEVLIAIS